MRTQEEAIKSGARRVEETDHLAAGLTQPKDLSAVDLAPEDGSETPDIKTHLTGMTLSMFTQGASTRVRVGNAHNASELYEYAFDSADEANNALIEAGILTAEQIPDFSKPAGANIPLEGITVQQLEAAGLKRHGASTI